MYCSWTSFFRKCLLEVLCLALWKNAASSPKITFSSVPVDGRRFELVCRYPKATYVRWFRGYSHVVLVECFYSGLTDLECGKAFGYQISSTRRESRLIINQVSIQNDMAFRCVTTSSAHIELNIKKIASELKMRGNRNQLTAVVSCAKPVASSIECFYFQNETYEVEFEHINTVAISNCGYSSVKSTLSTVNFSAELLHKIPHLTVYCKAYFDIPDLNNPVLISRNLTFTQHLKENPEKNNTKVSKSGESQRARNYDGLTFLFLLICRITRGMSD